MRVAGERAEEARALLIELFPEGFEEVEVDGGIEFAAYTKAGGEERLWQVFGPGAATDVDSGWREAWKRFHRPVVIGRLWVGPPWERPAEELLPVVVDPGQAFGTGAHPTTQLCLRFLLDHAPVSLLDLGCGSGVLSIAAAKLGYRPVTALDLDTLRWTRVVAGLSSTNVTALAADAKYLYVGTEHGLTRLERSALS